MNISKEFYLNTKTINLKNNKSFMMSLSSFISDDIDMWNFLFKRKYKDIQDFNFTYNSDGNRIKVKELEFNGLTFYIEYYTHQTLYFMELFDFDIKDNKEVDEAIALFINSQLREYTKNA